MKRIKPSIVILSCTLMFYTSFGGCQRGINRSVRMLVDQTVFIMTSQTVQPGMCTQVPKNTGLCKKLTSQMKPIHEHKIGSGTLIQLNGSPHILTAAHICRTDVPQVVSRWGITLTVKEKLVIMIQSHKIRSLARIIKIDQKKDLCLLRLVDKHKIQGAKISKASPRLGDKIHYSGAPLGYMSTSSLLIFDGRYSGAHNEKSLFSLPCAPGSSGSGIRNKSGEIVSILQRVDNRFHRICIGSTLRDIQAFLL